MENGVWGMRNGEWEWGMGNKKWEMRYGKWEMENGKSLICGIKFFQRRFPITILSFQNVQMQNSRNGRNDKGRSDT